ncbi:N-acetyltransferase [Weissella diestrammenae]|uniref:N-acetyltransferase n=1 Tax=Weissella diestrammenae TaxID=1162633 RepID=A0A7G9T5P5_9LACO|nr:N-acetyltransferase [Weissella diestrammenae]MCM0582246.1 N-acetyltransferase [Weissella diestrammenae]QNN75420.1 N-acetyltransferase [Weissella diestrammenae]
MGITTYKKQMATEVQTTIQMAFAQSKYGYQGENELVFDLRQDQKNKIFELVWQQAAKVVGHVMLSEASVGQTTGLVLAPLSVLPEYQHQGIGGELLRAAEQLAADKKFAFISILGEPAYYQVFGYQTASQFNITAPMPVPDDYFMVKPLVDLAQTNGKLVYAPAFKLNA